MSELARFQERVRVGRKVKGIAAALLPFDSGGRIAEDAFAAHLRATRDAGLVNAVNMDTGYANYLSDAEKERSPPPTVPPAMGFPRHSPSSWDACSRPTGRSGPRRRRGRSWRWRRSVA
jgi:hypothetical protein